MQRAVIIGTSVAGLCCARLLASSGWEIEIWETTSQLYETLVINDIARYLLQDIWELENNFWNKFHIINERHVCWGMANVLNIPQQNVVVKGEILIEYLLKQLLQKHKNIIYINKPPTDLIQNDQCTWVIDAVGRKSTLTQILDKCKSLAFGKRCVVSQEIMLAPNSNLQTCWFETTASGWVFLSPIGGKKGMLQCMVPWMPESASLVLENSLDQTQFLKFLVDSSILPASACEARPQILSPLCGQQWMAVGDTAFSVDPISGDNVGYAIRGAILAFSVLDKIASNRLIARQCLQHYTSRSRQIFFSHLSDCHKYYSASFSSSEWKSEIRLMLPFANNNIYNLEASDKITKLENINSISYKQ